MSVGDERVEAGRVDGDVRLRGSNLEHGVFRSYVVIRALRHWASGCPVVAGGMWMHWFSG